MKYQLITHQPFAHLARHRSGSPIQNAHFTLHTTKRSGLSSRAPPCRLGNTVEGANGQGRNSCCRWSDASLNQKMPDALFNIFPCHRRQELLASRLQPCFSKLCCTTADHATCVIKTIRHFENLTRIRCIINMHSI